MPDFPDAVRSEHLCDAQIALEEATVVGRTPYGMRSIHMVKDGTFAGPKLRGVFLPGGGDWLLSFDDGHNELDVRATLRTDDGVLIYVRYTGVLKLDSAVAARIGAGEDVSPDEYYFRGSPRFETAHPDYAWLNSTVCVSYGHSSRHRVSYRIFAIT